MTLQIAEVEIETPSSTVLVVEDYVHTIAGGLMCLEDEQRWRIAYAEDLETAERELNQKHFGLLLLDWGLPVAPGLRVDPSAGGTLLSHLKAGELGPNNSQIPFVVVTSIGRDIDKKTLSRYEGFLGVYYKNDDVRGLLKLTDSVRPTDLVSRWRTLVRVVDVRGDGTARYLVGVVPGWRSKQQIIVESRTLPSFVLDGVEKRSRPFWLLASADLAAESEEQLDLHDFEFAPEPVPEDDLV